jgi:hypothetical protein
MSWTTWAAVMTLPSAEIRTPEPNLGVGHEAAGAVDRPALGPDHDHGGADLPEQLLRILGLGAAGKPPEDDDGENAQKAWSHEPSLIHGRGRRSDWCPGAGGS